MSASNTPLGDASAPAPPQPRAAPMRFSSSHMESSVTRLLVATKMLLESITKWAAGACSEEHVSDIYVRLGNDFNAARLAFGSYGISMAELESVPEDLRACLEACLSEEASQAALDRHLPQVREIVVGLLQGLKSKQALYKEYLLASRQSRAANPTSPPSDSSPNQATSTPYPPSNRSTSNVSSRSTRSSRIPPPTSAQPVTDVQAARRESYHLLEQSHPRRGVMGPRSPPDHSRNQPSQPTQHASTSAHDDMERHILTDDPMPPYPAASGISPPGRDKSLPPAPVQTPSRHAASASISAASTMGSRRAAHHQHSSSSVSVAHSLRRSPLPTIDSELPMFFPHTPAEEDDGSDPSLRALKSRDALERRASKRFSAYTLNKMGISPSGFNAGLANMSPTPKRSARAQTGPSMPNLSPQKLAETLPDVPMPDAPIPLLPSPGRSATNGPFARGPKSSKRQSNHTSKSLPSNISHSELGIDPSPELGSDAIPVSENSLAPSLISTADGPTALASDGAISSEHLGPAFTDAIPGDNAPAAAADVESAVTPKAPASPHLSPPAVPHSLDVFVQLGRLTKKATLTVEAESPLTVARLRMLFVDRFGYSPGQDDFPAIYIKDPSTGVVYELEDLNDVHHGTLLTLNIDSLDQVRQHLDVSLGTLTRELRELKTAFNEQKERTRESPTSQQIQLLLSQAASNSGLPSSISSAAGLSAPLSALETPAREKISNEDFAAAGHRVALLARSATRTSRAAPSRSASTGTSRPLDEDADRSIEGGATTEDVGNTSMVLSGTAMAEDLQRQYEAVQRLREEMAVMKQVQREFGGDVGGLLRDLREQNKRVRALVSQDAPVQRSFIEAGKAQVDTQSQEVLTLVEDLQDTVDDLKMDVIQRKVTPRPQALKKIHADIAAAVQGLEQLERYVQSVKPAWKKTWEQELKVIVEEQEFLRHQEGLIMDLRDDQTALSDVFDQIQKVLRLRSAAARQVSAGKEGPGGMPTLRPVGFVPPPPDEEHKGLSTVALELRGQAVDHARRLRALQAAERAWAKERSEKEKDEFAQELAGFVDHKSLRRTGGHAEAERIRQKRDEATRMAMLSGDAQQVGGAPVNVGPITKPKRLIWGKNHDPSPLPPAGRPSLPRSASTATSAPADTSVTSALKSPQLGVQVEPPSSPHTPPLGPTDPEPTPPADVAAPDQSKSD